MKVYIAGPMSGLPNFNADAFDAAAMLLQGAGYEVFNPAQHDRNIHGQDFFDRNPDGDIHEAAKQGFSIRAALEADLTWICRHATHIAMLPGWENSKGARCEHALAVTLGLGIVYLADSVVLSAAVSAA